MEDDSSLKPMPNLSDGQAIHVVYALELEVPRAVAVDALQDYLAGLYAPDIVTLVGVGTTTANNTQWFDVKMSRTLTPEETTVLVNRIAAWTVPDVWYSLDRTISYPAFSEFVSEPTPRPTVTFININRRTAEYGMNAIKCVAEYRCDDVRAFADTPATATATFELYDVTRDWVMVSTTIDISAIAQKWATEAAALDPNNDVPVPSSVYKSVMLSDLWSKSVNYDTIWQIRASVDNPNVKIRVHGLQSLYYYRNVRDS